jgi:hypothetical protein
MWPFRARQPSDMRAAVDPVGPRNDIYLERHTAGGGIVIAAWGANGHHLDRDRIVSRALLSRAVELKCLHVTADGSPGHPMMLGYDRHLLTHGLSERP